MQQRWLPKDDTVGDRGTDQRIIGTAFVDLHPWIACRCITLKGKKLTCLSNKALLKRIAFKIYTGNTQKV